MFQDVQGKRLCHPASHLLDHSAFSTSCVCSDVRSVGQRAPRYDGKHYIGFSKIFQYDRPQAAALVQKALTESLPVYALFLFKEQAEEEPARLPQVDGYVWINSRRSDCRTSGFKA
jgi:hypothetical protein